MRLTFVSVLPVSRYDVLLTHGNSLSQFTQPFIHRWNCRVFSVGSSRHSLASVMRSHDLRRLDSDVTMTSWPAAAASEHVRLRVRLSSRLLTTTINTTTRGEFRGRPSWLQTPNPSGVMDRHHHSTLDK